jgi:Asp-tRNA(Asn)/Glu-tRNA(Gln) amidotransferase B subunit
MKRVITERDEFEGIEGALEQDEQRIQVIEGVIAAYPALVRRYRRGDEQALGLLIEQVLECQETIGIERATWMLKEWLSPIGPDGLPKRP